MIDWLKAIIPCQHSTAISGGMIVAFDPETGAVEWQTARRRAVEGSHSAKIHVTSLDEKHLIIDGNPSKFLQGHNVFGSNDLLGMGYEFFTRLSRQLELRPAFSDRLAWRRGIYTLRRVDVAESFQLGSQGEVAAWLRAAAPAVRGRHQAASAYSGETIYLGQRSRRLSLKVYNKWRELQKHHLPESLPNRDRLEQYAERLLRAEVRVLSMELKRRGLARAENWANPETERALLADRVGMMKLSEKARLSSDEISNLPPRLIAVYKLWQQGEDLRQIYPKQTFYRYRAELLKRGIDITTPQPKRAEVIPLVTYLTARYVPDIPPWAKGTELYFEPRTRNRRAR